MARITFLARRPRRTLGALAAVLAAVGIAVGSGASFTASSANPSNQFSAGTLTVGNSAASAILTAADMRPGDPASTGIVDIQNTGSLSGDFSLSRGAPSDTDATNPMSGKLNVSVTDCGAWSGSTAPTCDSSDPSKYSGTLSGMTAAVALGTFAAGEKRRYKFEVAFDSSATDAYQGGSSTVEFTWNAS
jgi:hypothetical protein